MSVIRPKSVRLGDIDKIMQSEKSTTRGEVVDRCLLEAELSLVGSGHFWLYIAVQLVDWVVETGEWG